jgi:hypothetical protein
MAIRFPEKEMLPFKFIKANPATHLMVYQRGRLVRQGTNVSLRPAGRRRISPPNSEARNKDGGPLHASLKTQSRAKTRQDGSEIHRRFTEC